MQRRSRSASNATKLVQLGLATPQVMAHRMARMSLAGPMLSARDRKEFTGMVVEKQVAFAQAWTGMMTALMWEQQHWLLACMTGQVPNLCQASERVLSKGLAPVHRKAVSNAKRLSRTRLR